MELYDRIVDKNLLIRRINITANRLVDENSAKKEEKYEQLDLFTDYKAKEQEQVKEEAALEREKRMQQTMLTIKKKFGKNAILKGMNLQEGATAKDRNEQIGGHKAYSCYGHTDHGKETGADLLLSAFEILIKYVKKNKQINGFNIKIGSWRIQA